MTFFDYINNLNNFKVIDNFGQTILLDYLEK